VVLGYAYEKTWTLYDALGKDKEGLLVLREYLALAGERDRTRR
jgi:hypothetical protein